MSSTQKPSPTVTRRYSSPSLNGQLLVNQHHLAHIEVRESPDRHGVHPASALPSKTAKSFRTVHSPPEYPSISSQLDLEHLKSKPKRRHSFSLPSAVEPKPILHTAFPAKYLGNNVIHEPGTCSPVICKSSSAIIPPLTSSHHTSAPYKAALLDISRQGYTYNLNSLEFMRICDNVTKTYLADPHYSPRPSYFRDLMKNLATCIQMMRQTRSNLTAIMRLSEINEVAEITKLAKNLEDWKTKLSILEDEMLYVGIYKENRQIKIYSLEIVSPILAQLAKQYVFMNSCLGFRKIIYMDHTGDMRLKHWENLVTLIGSFSKHVENDLNRPFYLCLEYKKTYFPTTSHPHEILLERQREKVQQKIDGTSADACLKMERLYTVVETHVAHGAAAKKSL